MVVQEPFDLGFDVLGLEIVGQRDPQRGPAAMVVRRASVGYQRVYP